MRAETIGNSLAAHPHGLAVAISVELDTSKAAGRGAPFQLRELLLSLWAHQAGRCPIRPIAAEAVTAIGGYKIELPGSPDIDIDLDRTAWSPGGHHRALEDRLYSGLPGSQLAGLL